MPRPPDGRTLVDLDLPLPADLSIARPEDTALRFPTVGTLDVGKLCYQRRSLMAIGHLVELDSFLEARRETVLRLIRCFSQIAGAGGQAWITQHGRARLFVNQFMSWVDDRGRFDALDTLDASYALFREYAEHLRDEAARGMLRRHVARRYCRQVAEVLGALHGVQSEDLLRGMGRLARGGRDSDATLPPDEEAQGKVLALCAAIFDGFSELVLSTALYPYALKVPAYLHYPNNVLWVFPTKRWCMTPPVLAERARLPKAYWPYDYSNGRIADLGSIQQYYFSLAEAKRAVAEARKKIEAVNRDPRHISRLIAAHAAQRAFLSLFMANTGLSESSALSLEWHGAELAVGAERHGFRAIKWRARGKQIACEVQATFLPTLRRYLKLRAFLLDGKPERLLFFSCGFSRSEVPKQVKPHGNGNFRKYLQRFDPDVPNISPRQWRAALSDWLVTNKDPETAAMVLQNTIPTVLEHYSEGSESRQVEEMRSFLRKLGSATVRESAASGNTDVARSVGTCVAYTHPAPVIDQPGVTPNCREPEGCLFCDKFRIHADEADVRKLLSCAYCLRKIKRLGNAPEQHESVFGSIFSRIEGIIDVIAQLHPDMVRRVSDEVAQGQLDSYWQGKLDLLLDLDLA